MTENQSAENPRLMSMASAISDGIPINWAQAEETDPVTTSVMDELRMIETLARMSDPMPVQWGAFVIHGEIGHGSYGTVYRAHDRQLDIELALKVIRPHALDVGIDPSHALREARLLAQINHPHVVRVYSAECLDQEVGIAMELVKGRTLHDLVRAQGPFSARETMVIGADVCGALAAVHGAGVLHGDIKANNVMRAEGGRTVLMDFGAGDDLKRLGGRGRSGAGTPLYLAPEVFAGAPHTVVSDIYSLGVLLFYLATGSYPVGGSSRTEIERHHAAHAQRWLLRDLRPDLPDAFIRVVERATSERPADRFQSAGELEAALHKAIDGTRIIPVPPFRIRNWRALATAASVVLVLGLASWLGTSRSTAPPSAATTRAPGAAPVATAAVAGSYQVEAAFYREQDGRDIRLEYGARVAPDDRLSLRVQSSIPLYVYIVNEDDRGASFLLYPLQSEQAAAPLPAGKRHEIPGVVNGERTFWRITSAGGREHFVVFATPDPPTPAFTRMFAELPRPTMGATILSQPLTTDLVGALRGVGGLATAPARPTNSVLTNEMTVPLPDGEETARGAWVRQLTLENPVK
jgi:serine/threonine-protein kinase